MNRNGLIAASVGLVALLSAIAVALVVLYAPHKAPSDEPAAVTSDYSGLLKAVPSDASILICRDSAKVRTVESWHNGGGVLKLFVSQAVAEPDSALAPFLYLPERQLLLRSSSETLLATSRRHLEEGYSILDSKGIAGALSSASGSKLVLLSHEQTPFIMRTCLKRAFRTDPGFFRSFADWTALSFKDSKSGIHAEGTSSFPDDPRSYAALLSALPSSEARFADIVPASAESAFSLHLSDIKSYLPLWKKYLDVKGRKEQYTNALEKTALELDIKEVAAASFAFGGRSSKVLMLRLGRKAPLGDGVVENPYRGVPEALFGSFFKMEDDYLATQAGEWIITGPSDVLEAYADKSIPGRSSLSRTLSDTGGPSVTGKAGAFTMYVCPSRRPAMVREIFAGELEETVSEKLANAVFIPVVFTAGGSPFSLVLDAAYLNPKTEEVPLAARDTVIVPTGPFTVRNGATGKDNTFYQNKNMYLCLNDENGKGVWGVPFKTPLCGRVQTIDYYANGKLQFLFASGSSLYLIDRLGRFVGGFPADLGKEVLIGPDVYDFTGAKGYTAVVLHKDNSIGMYNLHGEPSPSWKGIDPAGETIKNLPELLEVKGTKYWVVRTGRRTSIYPFEGGEALTKGDGDKMIRPDADIQVSSKGVVSAECMDGKIREIKL